MMKVPGGCTIAVAQAENLNQREVLVNKNTSILVNFFLVAVQDLHKPLHSSSPAQKAQNIHFISPTFLFGKGSEVAAAAAAVSCFEKEHNIDHHLKAWQVFGTQVEQVL